MSVSAIEIGSKGYLILPPSQFEHLEQPQTHSEEPEEIQKGGIYQQAIMAVQGGFSEPMAHDIGQQPAVVHKLPSNPAWPQDLGVKAVVVFGPDASDYQSANCINLEDCRHISIQSQSIPGDHLLVYLQSHAPSLDIRGTRYYTQNIKIGHNDPQRKSSHGFGITRTILPSELDRAVRNHTSSGQKIITRAVAVVFTPNYQKQLITQFAHSDSGFQYPYGILGVTSVRQLNQESLPTPVSA